MNTLFKDKHVSDWVNWWWYHNYLHMNIVAYKKSISGVRIVGSNQFDPRCQISIDCAPTEPARIVRPSIVCRICGKVSMDVL